MLPLPLRGRKSVERIRTKGKTFRGKHMFVTYLPGAPRTQYGKKGIFLGVVASTKLHKSAVKRNRMRRRCREAFRLTIKPEKTLPTYQLIINPKKSSMECEFGELEEDVRGFLQHIKKY